MLGRITFVAATAALALPLLGGTASASCLDDAQARRLDEGYTESPKSAQWRWIFPGAYVEQSGAATVTVHGDALVSDFGSYAVDDIPEWTQVVAANSVDTTADFADCVAG